MAIGLFKDDLEGVDFYTVGSDVLEYSHEILVQGSVTIDSRQVRVRCIFSSFSKLSPLPPAIEPRLQVFLTVFP